MKASQSFEMSGTTKPKEEDLKPQQYHSENVTSWIAFVNSPIYFSLVHEYEVKF